MSIHFKIELGFYPNIYTLSTLPLTLTLGKVVKRVRKRR